MYSEETIDLKYVPFPNPDVILQDEGNGNAVLVNFDTGTAVSLNAVGRFIWEKADGNLSVSGIIDSIEQSFLSVPDDISEDVTMLVKVLKLKGIFGVEVEVKDI